MKNIFLPVLLAFCISCAPSRIVKPLDKGQKVVSASLGGPLLNPPGIVFPIPFISLSGAKGVKEDLSVFGGLNLISMMFGVFQLDVGVVQGVFKQKKWRPGVSISPVGNFMIDHWEWNFRFYPQLDVNAYWQYGKYPNLLYFGTSNWFEITRKIAHDQPMEQHWVPDLHIGHSFASRKMNYTLEVKYMAPFNSNGRLVLNYVNINSRGAFGAYFGISRRF